jgi:hypothetical protein
MNVPHGNSQTGNGRRSWQPESSDYITEVSFLLNHDVCITRLLLACARQWKQSNVNGKLKDFEEF